MWAARDKDGKLCIYDEKPRRGNGEWFCEGDCWHPVDPRCLFYLKWEDNPIEVDLMVVAKGEG